MDKFFISNFVFFILETKAEPFFLEKFFFEQKCTLYLY